MAKLPGYIRVESIKRSGASVTYVISFRRWHPGFWWEIVKALWQRTTSP